MRIPLTVAAIVLVSSGLPVLAQTAEGPPPSQPGSERVNLVIVYGDDPCPKTADSGDIVVCGHMDEKDRYRIPEAFRGDPNAPANQAWAERFRSFEYVGRSGTESCSPSGGGGTTGCFNQLAALAKAERKQADNVNWADLVAAERAKRLAKIDAESEAIEARVKAEETKADAAAKASTPTPTPPPAATPSP